jgi:hypothetical protein
MRIKTKLHLSIMASVAAAAIIIPSIIFVGGKIMRITRETASTMKWSQRCLH